MARTRFALILYSRMVTHKAVCHTLSNLFLFEIYEDMVQILLMLTVFFTQDSEVENLFCGASPGSEPSCSSAIISSAWGFSLFNMTLSMALLG